MKLLSVVIPTCGRPGLLARALDAVLAQDLRPEAYEVIVVDDGPSAATEAVVTQRATASEVRLRYLRFGPRRGPAAARNLGWRSASGPVIAFTDDDCVPRLDWLRNGLAAMAEGVAGVSGRVVVPLPDDPTDQELNLTGLERSRFVTANCFYARSALEDAGGFDERFLLPWREDTDLYFTLLEQGKRLLDAPGAVVVHPQRERRWGASLREQAKVRFNALLYKKHPSRYRMYVQSRPPLRYYAACLTLLGAVAALIGGRRSVAGRLAGLWLAETAWLTIARLARTSKKPAHVVEMAVTSALIPPLAVYWRLRGAVRFKVLFL